ncbi:transporter [Afipia sp. P52-10]|jgi:membrane fusion protein (multidrug efflux system)|uniref:HlyD family secretion protein n=1 Tax=Afipia sp. P52-10 TaxID=1429916 RepID=UPI0003DF152A|nr:HlyD family secretion protein [Afipia sp. P52-10]ETR77508.1 transporter [Afipia sp. P52-10]
MADPVLKFPNEQPAAAAGTGNRLLAGRSNKMRRLILLVVIPLVVAVAGLAFYLSGGRYMTTDNAYVGAQKVLVTPDISGKIAKVVVREGQRVQVGDVLFEIDAEPFRLALLQAEARIATTRTDHANLQTNDRALGRMIELAQKTAELKRLDVERKSTLMANRSGSQFDLDASNGQLVIAQTQVEQLSQQQAGIRNQLLNNPDLPLEQFPPYMQAKAQLDQAQRDLNHTIVRAPLAGNATQVDNIQLGRYVNAGTPVLSIIDDANPWVDANPKETDFTYVSVGQKVTVVVDAFPNHTFTGRISSLSPGTGAQFAILPPQNASGNWVKVVQRVPIRITFDPDESTAKLRAGMSAYVSVDTGRSRSLLALLGLAAPAQEAAKSAAAATSR